MHMFVPLLDVMQWGNIQNNVRELRCNVLLRSG